MINLKVCPRLARVKQATPSDLQFLYEAMEQTVLALTQGIGRHRKRGAGARGMTVYDLQAVYLPMLQLEEAYLKRQEVERKYAGVYGGWWGCVMPLAMMMMMMMMVVVVMIICIV